MHLSDLHIGKRVNGFSMLEDQNYILKQIIEISRREKPDAVLIAGDVYDKPIPPAEAVQIFDSFLTELAQEKHPVFIISGNHDSPERLAFGSELMKQTGVYMASVYDGRVGEVCMEDSYGLVHVHMLPFVKPALVRRYVPGSEILSFDEAVRQALRQTVEQMDPSERHVLIAHQFVVGAACCESEELSIGGLDQVGADAFDLFDYVALGHIHGPQRIGRDTLRYCGTPLKYSFSEVNHKKSVTIAHLREKGNVSVTAIPLKPLRELREIRGSYEELTDRNYYQGTPVDDYLHITLTDEEDILDALGKLRSIYPNIMKLDYDNRRTREGKEIPVGEGDKKSPFDLLAELYELQNNQAMTREQADFAKAMMEDIWEGKK